MRTSLSHPLQIAEISAGPGLGRVGVTFCPGKKQPAALTGAWDRDTPTDVGAIANWGAAAVVTLIEDHEIASLAVDSLGHTVRSNHMEWLHFPIRDVSVPDAAFEKCWQRHGPGLRSLLRNGFNVLVHCKGGLGRAGMIACRLLIDCGVAPCEALKRVRQVRPGSVETQAQERYVLESQPLPEVGPTATTEDRAVGCLLGLAVGDAIGTTLEFTARDSRPPVEDMIGGGPFSLKAGEWTDDTAMALALAESLAVYPHLDESDLMRRFVEWQRQGTYSCTGRCFDIGITTRQALGRFERTGNPIAGSTDPMSAGNGSLMRLAAVPLRHWSDVADMEDVAARQSRTTHGALEAVDGCIAFARILGEAIAGRGRDEVLRPRETRLAPAIAAILAGSWRSKHRIQIKSSGYVVHSLEAALWAVGRTTDFKSAVLLAANLGDDADTVAAITGQLAGALYGRAGIPKDWLDRLAWRPRLEAAATGLLH